MGQDLGTVTTVMGSRIPAFKGELLDFEDWKWESYTYMYVEHKDKSLPVMLKAQTCP